MGTAIMQSNTATLADVIERILDKGLIINADITVSIVGVELLGIKIRAAVASFETAARYGLEFPSGTKLPQGIPEDKPLTVSNNGHHKVAALSEI
ncbi:MAG: gas vesicle protein [Chloroflexi bacterium]|nr:gas vesicle protein [Chloroflexota bacterium]